MKIQQLKRAAKVVLRLISEYSSDSAKQREMRQDPLLLGFFQARFGNMSRQTRIWIGNTTRPKRVDFRRGGPNPVLVEFAVRTPSGASELYGSQNKSELNKLTRFPQSRAKLRVLLLLDLKAESISKLDLKATYDAVKSSRGRFARHHVRVIYVHRDIVYDFSWMRKRG